ncbi:hypothetical protein [Burkholderia gladioli]|uniref:hypothetical protein n=1 Tax=Burkholderia gladioli TaxID=28095 RepID=UPI003D36FA7D
MEAQNEATLNPDSDGAVRPLPELLTANFSKSRSTLYLPVDKLQTMETPIREQARGLVNHGFVARIAAIAGEKGVLVYVGEGLNRRSAVHRPDAARVYRLALEDVTAGPFHAIGETGVSRRDIAAAASHSLDLLMASLFAEAAATHATSTKRTVARSMTDIGRWGDM